MLKIGHVLALGTGQLRRNIKGKRKEKQRRTRTEPKRDKDKQCKNFMLDVFRDRMMGVLIFWHLSSAGFVEALLE